MAHRIDYPGSRGYNKVCDCIVETKGELTTDSELVDLDPFSIALCLNTDVGADADISIHIKLTDGTWKEV